MGSDGGGRLRVKQVRVDARCGSAPADQLGGWFTRRREVPAIPGPPDRPEPADLPRTTGAQQATAAATFAGNADRLSTTARRAQLFKELVAAAQRRRQRLTPGARVSFAEAGRGARPADDLSAPQVDLPTANDAAWEDYLHPSSSYQARAAQQRWSHEYSGGPVAQSRDRDVQAQTKGDSAALGRACACGCGIIALLVLVVVIVLGIVTSAK